MPRSAARHGGGQDVAWLRGAGRGGRGRIAAASLARMKYRCEKGVAVSFAVEAELT